MASSAAELQQIVQELGKVFGNSHSPNTNSILTQAHNEITNFISEARSWIPSEVTHIENEWNTHYQNLKAAAEWFEHNSGTLLQIGDDILKLAEDIRA